MRLNKFTDLGLRIVMRLAVQHETPAGTSSSRELVESARRASNTRTLAAEMGVSAAHAAKVVTRLSALGVVTTRRGRGGGLLITELGRDASLGWLARRLEGDEEVVECEGDRPCPLRTACSLRGVLRDAQLAFFAELDRYTVADVASVPATRNVVLTLTPRLPHTRMDDSARSITPMDDSARSISPASSSADPTGTE